MILRELEDWVDDKEVLHDKFRYFFLTKTF